MTLQKHAAVFILDSAIRKKSLAVYFVSSSVVIEPNTRTKLEETDRRRSVPFYMSHRLEAKTKRKEETHKIRHKRESKIDYLDIDFDETHSNLQLLDTCKTTKSTHMS